MRDNLYVYGRYFGMSRAAARAKTTELLDFVQLTDRASDTVEQLSGGMKRRLTIARSLVNDPELMLLDEPTTGLDPQARHLLWNRLFRLRQQGVTLIITTHYMDEAEQLCDRLVVMDGGLIVAEGSPRELIVRYSTREVLELRFAPDAQQGWQEKLTDLADRVEELPDRLLLYAPDGEAALAAANQRGARPLSTLVRRSTLEDVFLRFDRPNVSGLMTRGSVIAHFLSRTLTGWAGPLRVVEGLWTWYRRNWRATAVSSLLQPLLMLVAFGVGFGSLIDTSARAAQAIGGVPYLGYLAPALLTVSAVQTAA